MSHKITLLIAFLTLFAIGCKKGGNSSPAEEAPSNLEITANVKNDGSGFVSFTAVAINAVSYSFEFGDGVVKTSAIGTIPYQYNAGGTFTVNVTATGSTGLTTKKSINVTVSVAGSGLGNKLVWSDEFNTDGAPDPIKWGYDIGGGGWGNGELEYYTSRPQNVIVQGGNLKIIATKENYGGSAYTSARILSKGKFAFTYGRVEIKAKIPGTMGAWPALWMLGSNINTSPWPACGEIDIMEARGSEPNKIFGTLHYPGRNGGNADGGTKVITNASTDFHIYSLNWTAASINISVDGQLIHTVANSSAIPFNHDFFALMNVAVGGSFGGNVAPNFTSDSLVVDYIRVYQ